MYRTDTGKVRKLRAWVIRPTGEAIAYDKKDIIDRIMIDDDVYNEARVQEVYAVDDVVAGSVFGYESRSQDRSIFTQYAWQFQRDLPALHSRFRLTLPEDWRVQSVTFNHASISPGVQGNTYTWELLNLPKVEVEPAGPEFDEPRTAPGRQLFSRHPARVPSPTEPSIAGRVCPTGSPA